MSTISNRKSDHVSICINEQVDYDNTNGLSDYSFIHCALPEVDFKTIDTKSRFLGYKTKYPFFISGMTGGYEGAIAINSDLAEICDYLSIPMILGSQRAMLVDRSNIRSYSIVREISPDIIISANIGATEIRNNPSITDIQYLLEAIEAQCLTIHCNPLQELMQPEGDTNYSGVLKGIEHIVKNIDRPVIVKEVGAGISGEVAKKLLDIGVQGIDVAGSGGTSWASVELMRRTDNLDLSYFKNWGIPTADSLNMVRSLKQKHSFSLFASGGINNAHDIAMAIALGADAVGAAKIILQTLTAGGKGAVIHLIEGWMTDVKRIMFLTGCQTIDDLQNVSIMRK